MTQVEFDRIAGEVSIAMKQHVMPFTTPIAKVTATEQGDVPGTTRATEGKLWGTGNYVTYDKKILLVTNEHVAKEVVETPLTHQFYGGAGDEPKLLNGGTFPSISYPTDAAITEIRQSIWNGSQHSARAISISEIAEVHSPIDGELLFMLGYSGARSSFFFNYLNTPSTSYVCQETKSHNSDPNVFMPTHHFALDYRPDRAKSVEPGGVPLPVPNGFSGSFVWDTKRIKYYREGWDWSPACARITGLIWGWPSGAGVLLATKVEYVRNFMEKGFPLL